MASFRKRGRTWTATVDRVGFKSESRTFPSKALAEAWARVRESELLAGKRGQIMPHSVREALRRFSAEVAPKHAGWKWDVVRLAKFERELPFVDRGLSGVSAADIADWRDRSLLTLQSSSVRREMVLLRSVFEVARKEWGWLLVNPMKDVDWPKSRPPRRRRVEGDEVERILLALNYEPGTKPANTSQRVALAVLWAVETAMRAGEIAGLTWDCVDVAGRSVTLPKTKNGDRREVPLSRGALALLDLLPRGRTVFDLSSASIDALFRKAKKRAGVVGLTFHDTRAEALTRMSKKVDVLTLARIAGHRDLRSLSVYYRESTADIAARLD